jgi:hypothetical protein
MAVVAIGFALEPAVLIGPLAHPARSIARIATSKTVTIEIESRRFAMRVD